MICVQWENNDVLSHQSLKSLATIITPFYNNVHLNSTNMNITITKYPKHKDSVLNAFKYWHLIQYEQNGYKYDCNMTDEGMMYLIHALKLAGNNVSYTEKE